MTILSQVPNVALYFRADQWNCSKTSCIVSNKVMILYFEVLSLANF